MVRTIPSLLLFLYFTLFALNFFSSLTVEILSFGIVFIALLTVIPRKIKIEPYFKWILLFTIYVLVSSIWALKPRLTFWIVTKIIMIWTFTLSVCFYIKSFDDLYRLLKLFFYSNIVLTFYLLIIVGPSGLGEDRIGADQLGEGWNANSIGMSMVWAINSFFLFWKKEKSKTRILFYLFFALLMFVLVLYTGSRKALFLIFAPIAIYFLFQSKKSILYKACLIIIPILITLYIVMNVPSLYNVVGIRLEQTLLQIEGGNDVKVESSMFVRYGLITYGLEWFKQRPILGYGANNFRVMSDQTYEFLGMNFYAHNNYIELLVGVGIIGLLIYYWGYIFIISKSIRIWNSYTKLALTLIIISLFIDIANVSYYSILSQFVLCIAFILIRLPIEHEKS